ncbi:vWA domain-containing protein [Deinococcus koreensis]|uniref:vWA domain-containing protein n=1 Tax=Deinococcus koreensis TaxID=2054903 RepID=UPI001FB03232|nr:vWA domain-containing protein [Deinococcus koreensis]
MSPAPCELPPGPLPTLTRAVFVLDTSGSMRGLGDGRADIFGRVKASINTYVRQARPDRVELLTFDSGVRSRQGFAAPAGTPRWNGALGALRADGQSTHLYRSLHAALSPLTAGAYLTTVFVLTDGIDNDPARAFTPGQALAAFGGRGPLDRLHYLALGAAIPADARQALAASPYADGLTVPLGQVPDLRGAGLEGGLVTVTDAARVPVPFPEGTPLSLAGARGLQLQPAQVQGGRIGLKVAGRLPYGSAALLCAGNRGPGAGTGSGTVAGKPRRVLLRLNLPGTWPLRWLNPGADRVLAAGEEVGLRYRAAPGQRLQGLRLSGLPPKLRAEVRRLPASREFEIRLLNRGLTAGTLVTPTLTLPGGAATTLPAIRAAAGGRVGAAPAAGSANGPATGPVTAPPQAGQAPSSLQGQPRLPRRVVWGLLILAALGLAGALLLGLRRRRGPVAAPPRAPAAPAMPTVEGIEYSEDRLLALVSPSGDVTGVVTPLDGPFDLGHLARVPHLSGLRLEQHRHGLKCNQIPPDLEVSQGARLLRAGDIVRPGTLLGVAVARPSRAPQTPLGSLAGLGLPLTLRTQHLTLHLVGPYGEHVLALAPGLTDLGATLQAPALNGLSLSTSGTGGRVLLVDLPPQLTVRRLGELTPVTPGTYLPAAVTLDLPDPQD